jgi:hypothetical protein
MARAPHLADTTDDVVAEAMYSCILKVPNSNLGRVTGYPE